MAAGDDDVTHVTRSVVSLMPFPPNVGGVRVALRGAPCNRFRGATAVVV
jgi:hypothetical protein